MSTATHILPPDTQAILLLYGRFGQTDSLGPKPLALGEYNTLAKELRQHNMRPADLLSDAGFAWVRNEVNSGLDAGRVIGLLERGGLLGIKVEEWTNHGLWILSRSDNEYPQRLKRKLRQEAPPILYGVGNKALLNKGGLAVVGSRDVDEAGLDYSRRLCQECARRAVQVVSGGARGVDRESMLAVVEAGGEAIGILANDLEKESVSRKYRNALKNNQLVLVSPFTPKARFNVGNAMARNKYIYALADHALVISSDYNKGGTWAGATEELNRDNQILVWVRAQGVSVPEGNRQLEKLGALPLPENLWEDSFLNLLVEKPCLDSGSILNASISNHQKNVIPEAGYEKQVTNWSKNHISSSPKTESKLKDKDKLVPKSIFEAIFPVLKCYLKEPRRQKELAKFLDVQQAQVKAWLEHAITLGLVKKTSKGYVLLPEEHQIALGLSKEAN